MSESDTVSKYHYSKPLASVKHKNTIKLREILSNIGDYREYGQFRPFTMPQDARKKPTLIPCIPLVGGSLQFPP